MPILIRRDSPSTLLNLAADAGSAMGNAQRIEAQRNRDHDIIMASIGAALTGQRGGYGGSGGGGGGGGDNVGPAPAPGVHTVHSDAYDQNQSLWAGMSPAERRDARKAQEDAAETARRRAGFSAAADQGPEALSQYLIGEEFADKGRVPSGFLDKIVPDVKNGAGAGAGTTAGGPKDNRKVSQFQRDAEGGITGGNMAPLSYLNDQTKPAIDPNTGQPSAQMPTQKAIEAANALQAVTAQMDTTKLKALRAQLTTAPITQDAKQRSLAVVDAALGQKQGMRDVEIQQGYEAAARKVQAAVIKTPVQGPMPRVEQQAKYGRMIAAELAKMGINPSELQDYLQRKISGKLKDLDPMGDIQAVPGQPQLGGGPANPMDDSDRGGAGGPDATLNQPRSHWNPRE